MRLTNPLGSYDTHDEFQVERVIVNILISLSGPRDKSVRQGHAMFPDAWNAIPDVVAFAETKAAGDLPLIWQQLKTHISGAQPLVVLGMWLDPAKGSVDYHVAENFEYPFPDSVDIPDDYAVFVQRDKNGELRLA